MRIVIKVGTNVLTQPNQQLDYNIIHHIVGQIGQLHAQGHQVVLVTSGAKGAAGGLADFSAQKERLLRRQMMCAVGQGRLMQIYTDFCREQNIIPAQALLTRADFANREHFLNVRDVILGLLDMSVLPIINENDVVATDALTFGDNDQLSAAVAAMIEADRLVLMTTAPGFFLGGDPAHNPNAQRVPVASAITPEMWAACDSTLTSGGTGGMLSKLKAAELVCGFGIQAHIVQGKLPNVVPRLLAGEDLGTTFLPTGKGPRGYQRWLRIGALTTGRLVVDMGAQKALAANKSLLPAGVTRLEGEFHRGDIVDVYNAEGEKLALGVATLGSHELAAHLAARATGGLEAGKNSEVIHKDRMLWVGHHQP